MEDWKKWRNIAMKKYGKTYNDTQKCPVCRNSFKIRSMHCHHLIPKAAAPHLMFNPNNLVFVCKPCHKRIHEFMDGKTRQSIVIEHVSDDFNAMLRYGTDKLEPHKWKKDKLLQEYLKLAGEKYIKEVKL